MIRTQVYLEDQIHKDLLRLAAKEHKSMAQVTRDILKEGIKKRTSTDTSGKSVLLAIANLNITSGDRHLSKNIDHYLYGAPKKNV